MTKRILAAAILIVLSVFWPPKSTRAETVYTTKTLYSVADIWVSNFKANENGGDDASISIGFFGAELRLGLIKFDLSEIPSNATITSASFNLYMIQTETGCNGTPSPNLLMIGQNTSDWAEGTTGWNGKPGYSASVSYSSPACPAHWYYISTTNIVRNWIGGQSNYGFQIFGPDGGNTYYRNFNTRESASSWARPQLVVSYSYPRPEDPAPASNPSDNQPSDSNSTPSSSNNSNSVAGNTTANPNSNSSNASTSPNDSSSGSASTTSPADSNSSGDKMVNLSNDSLGNNKLLQWLNSLSLLERRLLVGGIIALIIALTIILRRRKRHSKNEQKGLSGRTTIRSNEPEPQAHDLKQTTQQSASSKTNKKLALIVITVILILGVGGYALGQFATRKAGKNITEKILETSTGGKVDTNTSSNGATVSDGSNSYSTGSSASWPSNLPAGIPKYPGGEIASVNITDTPTWSIMLGGTTRGHFDSYKSALLTGGWTSVGDSRVMVDSIMYQKDDWTLNVSFIETSGAVIITVYKTSY